jgi:hypothetical protein
MHNRQNKLYEKWDVVYVNNYRAPKKGDYDKYFGLHYLRPFHIVSAMRKHRYLDLIGRNLVTKTPNGRKSQIFWFDYKTKTIKSQQNRGWSFNINGNGG